MKQQLVWTPYPHQKVKNKQTLETKSLYDHRMPVKKLGKKKLETNYTKYQFTDYALSRYRDQNNENTLIVESSTEIKVFSTLFYNKMHLIFQLCQMLQSQFYHVYSVTNWTSTGNTSTC